MSVMFPCIKVTCPPFEEELSEAFCEEMAQFMNGLGVIRDKKNGMYYIFAKDMKDLNKTRNCFRLMAKRKRKPVDFSILFTKADDPNIKNYLTESGGTFSLISPLEIIAPAPKDCDVEGIVKARIEEKMPKDAPADSPPVYIINLDDIIDSGVDIVKACKAIRIPNKKGKVILNLKGNLMGKEKVKEVFHIITKKSLRVITLILDDNPLYDESMAIIGKFVHSSIIENLSLGDTGISDKGIKMMAQHLGPDYIIKNFNFTSGNYEQFLKVE